MIVQELSSLDGGLRSPSALFNTAVSFRFHNSIVFDRFTKQGD